MTDFVLQEKTKNNCIFINLWYALRVMQVFMTTRVCKLSDSHLFYLILKKKKSPRRCHSNPETPFPR